MTKRLMVLIVITCLLAATLYAGEKKGKSFLWEVDTGTSKSYLLGSVHIFKKENYPLKKVIEDAYAASEVLVLEAVDTSKVSLLLKKAMYKGDETLKTNISEETFKKATAKLEQLGQKIDAFLKFKPWMVGVTIMGLQLAKDGFKADEGIDFYFMKRAKGKKEMLELEGYEFQANIFGNLTKEESEMMLKSTLDEADSITSQFNKILKAWNDGDTEGMEKVMLAEKEKAPKEMTAFLKKFNDDRNVGMAKKIDTFLKTGKTHFIVVGSLHMVGKKGLPKLLKEKGYKIKQL
ncbi:MAG: TraB/GumN family protein [bacterium]|nr:TraB/GumN family protein [bacterium]